jgi:hypothetical protein
MPGNERISSIINEQSVSPELKTLIDQLEQAAKIIREFPKVTSVYKDSSSHSEMKKNTDEMIRSNDAAKKKVDELTLAVKEYEKILAQQAAATAKFNAGQSDAAKQLASTREQVRLQSLEVKNQTTLQQAAEGSIVQMRAQLSLLTKQYDALSEAERNSTKGQNLQAQVEGQVNALKKLEAETGRFQRNVGNYTGAVKILEKGLQDVKTRMDNLTQAGKGHSDEMAQLESEYELLGTMVNKQSQGFTTLSREVMMMSKQLETMANAGMQSTTAFKDLETAFVAAKSQMKEFQLNQQLLTSPAAGLQAMTLSAKALGGVYATSAGAAALFANGNEKVEKELQKLMAIMTILQGLNEIHEFVEKRGAIATIARAAAEKLKNFVMTGSTKGIEENTVAMGVNTTVMEGTTIATKATTAAMVGLRFALIATGIGALLILLPTIAAAMSSTGESAKKATKEVKEFGDAEKELQTAMHESNSAFVEARKAVNDVTEALALAKAGVISKKEAVDVYNTALGKAMGSANSLKDVEEKMSDKKRVQAYVDMMMYKAAANYELEAASKAAAAAAEEQAKPKEEKTKWYDFILNSNTTASYGGNNNQSQLDATRKKDRDKQLETRKKEAVDDKNNEMDFHTKIAGEFQTKYQDLAKKFKIDPLGGGDDKKGGKNATSFSSEAFKQFDAAEKAAFETWKINMSDAAAVNKEMAANDKLSFDKRIEAAQNWYNQTKAISDKQQEFDLGELRRTTDQSKLEVNEKLKQKGLTTKQRDDLNKELLGIDKNYSEQGKLINAKYNSEIFKLNSDSEKMTTDLMEKEKEKRLKLQEEELKQKENHLKSMHEIELQSLDNDLQTQLNKLDADYSKKKKHTDKEEKEYQNLKLKIQEDYQIKALEKDIEFTKETISLAEARAKASGKQEDIDAVASAKSKLSSIEIKLQGLKTKAVIDSNNIEDKSDKDLHDKRIARMEKVAAYAKQVQDIIGGFINNSIEKNKNALQDEQDAMEKKYEKEVDLVNKSSLTEEQKAARLKVLESEKQTHQEQIDRKRRQLDVEKAKFEKAANIAGIISATALAVAKALPNIPLALLVGAMGAAELVIAATAPIPKYKQGTQNHPGGPAIVGDGGVPELIELPTGEKMMSPSISTLIDLPSGTKVKPGELIGIDELNQSMMISMIRQTANFFDSDINRLMGKQAELTMWQTQEFKKALNAQKKTTVVNNHIDLGWSNYLKKNVFD